MLFEQLQFLSCQCNCRRWYARQARHLHAVKPGPANQSYGLQVARLAGIPSSAITLARQKLQLLEQQSTQSQGDLFAELPRAAEPETNAALDALDDIDPDELTPKQALELLYRLKQLAKS